MFMGDVVDIGAPSDDTVSTAKIQDDAVTTAKINDDAVTAAKIDANAVGNSAMADDAVGIAELSATGTASATTFLRGDNSWATAGGDLSFGGDTFGADKTIGSNDAYALSLETDGNVAMKLDALGHITKPLQSAFLCRGLSGAHAFSSSWTGVTNWNTATFDQNSDVGAQYFTAPVTGKYLIGFSALASSVTAGADLEIRLITSNNNYGVYWEKAMRGTTYGQTNSSWIVDMDASDTAYVSTIDTTASGTLETSATSTHFFGYLVC
jgi:hypothetical protein